MISNSVVPPQASLVSTGGVSFGMVYQEPIQIQLSSTSSSMQMMEAETSPLEDQQILPATALAVYNFPSVTGVSYGTDSTNTT